MTETILAVVLAAWIISILAIVALYESHLTRETINGIEAEAYLKMDRRNRMRHGIRSTRNGKMVREVRV